MLQQQVLVRAAGDRESGEQHIIWVNHPIRINPSPLASPRHSHLQFGELKLEDLNRQMQMEQAKKFAAS